MNITTNQNLINLSFLLISFSFLLDLDVVLWHGDAVYCQNILRRDTKHGLRI
jgi:hypothetical protein